jgi:hypothetical protein
MGMATRTELVRISTDLAVAAMLELAHGDRAAVPPAP